jgi:hypothetical protein
MVLLFPDTATAGYQGYIAANALASGVENIQVKIKP